MFPGDERFRRSEDIPSGEERRVVIVVIRGDDGGVDRLQALVTRPRLELIVPRQRQSPQRLALADVSAWIRAVGIGTPGSIGSGGAVGGVTDIDGSVNYYVTAPRRGAEVQPIATGDVRQNR